MHPVGKILIVIVLLAAVINAAARSFTTTTSTAKSLTTTSRGFPHRHPCIYARRESTGREAHHRMLSPRIRRAGLLIMAKTPLATTRLSRRSGSISFLASNPISGWCRNRAAIRFCTTTPIASFPQDNTERPRYDLERKSPLNSTTAPENNVWSATTIFRLFWRLPSSPPKTSVSLPTGFDIIAFCAPAAPDLKTAVNRAPAPSIMQLVRVAAASRRSLENLEAQGCQSVVGAARTKADEQQIILLQSGGSGCAAASWIAFSAKVQLASRHQIADGSGSRHTRGLRSVRQVWAIAYSPWRHP